MKKLKLLQSLALAGAASSMFVAPSAQAQSTCPDGPPFPTTYETTLSSLVAGEQVQCGDKFFSDFTAQQADGLFRDLFVDFSEINPTFYDVDFETGLFGPLTNLVDTVGVPDYIYEYNVAITEPDFFFEQISIDSNIAREDEINDSIIFTKEVYDFEGGSLITTLVSENGNNPGNENIANENLQNVFIRDLIEITDGGAIVQDVVVLDFTNDFIQDEHDTPEPASMLGILAVGGLGFAMRRKQGKK